MQIPSRDDEEKRIARIALTAAACDSISDANLEVIVKAGGFKVFVGALLAKIDPLSPRSDGVPK